ncbi:Ger(x)C family spore germination protein [Halalkalibacter alkalisediminis]|uniref:Ger(X)C family spore germination protein n=1 Tax=Halalkalibacter alkalisediminis TaxID=935616 RepID=A0ABV6NJ68_9BACI|nr:Ger(x)C family spore germination protein [Halalkalibacter alkalisediminis]
MEFPKKITTIQTAIITASSIIGTALMTVAREIVEEVNTMAPLIIIGGVLVALFAVWIICQLGKSYSGKSIFQYSELIIGKPGSIPLGTGGDPSQKESDTVKIVEVVGRTIDDAWENLEQQISLPLFMGHLRVLVVSEEFANAGLGTFGDFLKRSPQIRRTAWMLVAEGTADQYMELDPELQRIPALYLVTAIDEAIRIGKFPEEYLGIAWSKNASLGREPILPYVSIKANGNLEISGLAYFNQEKLVGTTKAIEVGRYMAIMGIHPAGYSVLLPYPEQDVTIMFNSVKRKSKIKIEMNNGLPHLKVRVHVDGEIEEVISEDFKVNTETIPDIEKQLAKNAKESFITLIKKTQTDQSDIFGFGEHVRAKERSYWNKNIRTKEKWLELYKDLPVDVEVTASIKRVGMKNE